MRVFGVVGWKNNGKTTLVERLVGHLTGRGLPASRPSSTPITRSISTSRARTAGAIARPAPGGGARHRAALGGDPRAARRSRAAAGRAARPDDAGRPGPRRRLQALLPPQARGASARARHPAAGRRGRLASSRSRPTSRCRELRLPQFDLDDVPAIAAFVLERVSILAAAMSAPCPGLLRLWRRADRGARGACPPAAADRAGRRASSRSRLAAAARPLPRRAADQPARRARLRQRRRRRLRLRLRRRDGARPGARLPLAPGRAAAGHPFPGELPPGSALRVLTGADDARGRRHRGPAGRGPRSRASAVTIPPGLKRGANRRRAGEDVRAGETVLAARHAAAAAGDRPRRRARAAPRSRCSRRCGWPSCRPATSWSSRAPASSAGRVFDANRPILRALLRRCRSRSPTSASSRDEPERCARTLERAAAQPSCRAHLRRRVARRRGPCRPHASRRAAGSISGRSR